MPKHFKIMDADSDTKLTIIAVDDDGNEYKVTEKGDISLSDTFRLEFKKYLESKGADTNKMDWEEMNIAFTGETMKGFFGHIKLKYG